MTNPITTLRLKRAKSKRAPMPVSKKPRKNHADRESRINFYSQAGSLLYGRLIAGVTGIRHDITMDIILERDARNTARSKRMRLGRIWRAARATSGEAARRRGQKLTQHPSVIARFVNHPSRSQIDAELAKVERAA